MFAIRSLGAIFFHVTVILASIGQKKRQ